MKKAGTIISIFLLVLLLVVGAVCGWLYFVNKSLNRKLNVMQERCDLLEEDADQWKKQAEDLQSQLDQLQQSTSEETAAAENKEKTEKEKADEKKEKSDKQKGPVDLTKLETLETGTLVDLSLIDEKKLDQYFQAYRISDKVFDRIYGDDRSYKTYCTIPREDLTYIKVLHYNFDGKICVGEMIANVQIKEDLLYIFKTLFENKYQIEKMILVEAYGADDDTSVNDNNTSCFNYRAATDATTLSNHATGCAVDINPKQNPYFRILEDGSYDWDNDDAELYIDRTDDPAGRHMINYDDLCYQLFTERGFSWGGDWPNPIDYQHFEKPFY